MEYMMNFDRSKLNELKNLPDDKLWESLKAIAKTHGITLGDRVPSSEELRAVRDLLCEPEKINLSSAMRLINNYKKGGK